MRIVTALRVLLLLLCASMASLAQTHTEVTVEDTKTVTGDETFSGNVTTTAGRNAVRAYSLSGTVVVEGKKYARTDVGVNAAINALPGGPGVGVVYLTNGNYTFSGTVNNRTNTRILCDDGAVITIPNATFLTNGVISFAGADRASLQNCTVDGNRAGNTDGNNQVLVTLSGSTNATVEENWIRNSTGVGVYTGTGTTPTVRNNQFSNHWSNGLQLGFTGATVATKGTVTGNAFASQADLSSSFSDGNVINGNKIIGYGQAQNVTTTGTAVAWVSGTNFTNLSPGMYVCIGSVEYLISAVGSSTSMTLSSTAGNQTNVLSYAGTADSLNLTNSSNNTVTGNVVDSGEGYGIVVFQSGSGEAALHNVIAGNAVKNTGGDCIAVNSTNASPMTAGTVVNANAISNCGQGTAAKGTSINREAIELNGAGTHYSVISGNSIYDDQGSPTTLWGVILQSGVPTDQTVDVNQINGMVSGAVSGLTPVIATHFNTSGDSVSSGSGTATFRITVGTGAGTSSGKITLRVAPTAWDCHLDNQNRADHIQQTASDATSATFTNYGTGFAATNWTNGDVLIGFCKPN